VVISAVTARRVRGLLATPSSDEFAMAGVPLLVGLDAEVALLRCRCE
jgi:hypothetical protein